MAGLTAIASEDGLYDEEDNVDQDYEEENEKEEFDQDFTEDIKSVRIMIGGLNSNNKKIQTIKNLYAKAIKSAQQRENS